MIIQEMLFSSCKGFYFLGRAAAESVDKNENIFERMSPAMMNMTFCVEIMLKGVCQLVNGEVKGGHSLTKLFNRLPEKDRKEITESYDFHRTNIPEADKLPSFIFSITKKADPKDTMNMKEDLETFLKVHDNCFVSWRYFFEYGTTSISLPANFHCLECLILALKDFVNKRGLKTRVMKNTSI